MQLTFSSYFKTKTLVPTIKECQLLTDDNYLFVIMFSTLIKVLLGCSDPVYNIIHNKINMFQKYQTDIPARTKSLLLSILGANPSFFQK